ncbi:LysR family transcriptional regulator [Xanthobacter dioxanivorans]|uniref:LysR family transcriptional regulator n=1 Tax=Xanthobacter dioxanivorans TaxID=2528964 RepID=A0A974PSY9_9HYPH|nr:LysR substrate-binding domain-containing protein [Xanthobacter dioxanivorans]QRG08956.1 LysR family transcriptional regulator [Xanthobacter dioxanivorans]
MKYELRHLSAFVAVAEELSFHRAAERLHLAQPAVSRTVRELEERIGVALLWRSTRVVRLTEAGRQFLVDAKALLGSVRKAEERAQLIASGTLATLRIGYTTINGHTFVADTVRDYLEQNPHVRVELTFQSAPRQRDMLLENQLDFAFLEYSYQNPAIDSLAVARHRLHALMHPDHPLAARAELTLADLVEHHFVIGTQEEWPTMRAIIAAAFDRQGLTMPSGIEASSLTGILGLVTSGLAYTIFCGVPRFCGGEEICIRSLAGGSEMEAQSYLSWRRNDLTKKMEQFIDLCRTKSDRNETSNS